MKFSIPIGLHGIISSSNNAISDIAILTLEINNNVFISLDFQKK